MRGGMLAVLVLSLVLISVGPAAASAPRVPGLSALAMHSPIVISSDSGFTAANGVTGGSGTPSDPYIIEGWNITPGGGTGIHVENTSSSVVVRNLAIWSSTVPSQAAWFTNVSNVALVNVTLTAFWGAFFTNSTNVSVVDSTISAENGAVLFIGSTETSAQSNKVSDAISALRSTDVVIRSNSWGDYAPYGILITESQDVNVSYNSLNRALNPGIDIDSSRAISVYQNFVGNSRTGISVRDSSNVSLTANQVYLNGLGIDLARSANVTMRANRFHQWDALLIEGSLLAHFNSHEIGSDNLLETGPIVYRKDCAPDTILDFTRQSPGEVIVVNCPGVRVSNLTFGERQVALELAFVQGGEVSKNSFQSIWQGGVILDQSSRVVVHHNFFVDTWGRDDSSSNSWNAAYTVGGNWWSGYRGKDECSGPYQDRCPDPDGIGDFPAPVDPFRTIFDRYPLMWPWNRTGSPPVARFAASSLRVERDAIVTFNASASYDPDGHPLQVRWDWEGDGIWDTWWSSDLVAQHAYTAVGTFNVRVVVRDVDGYWTGTSQFIEVTAPAPSIWLPLGLLLVFAALIVAYVTVRLRVKRGRGRTPPQEPSHPP